MYLTPGAHPLFAVLKVEHHLALPREKGQGQPPLPQTGVLPAGHAQVEGLAAAGRRLQIGQGADGVNHQLGLLVVPDGYLALSQNGAVLPDIAAALVQRPGEAQQLREKKSPKKSGEVKSPTKKKTTSKKSVEASSKGEVKKVTKKTSNTGKEKKDTAKNSVKKVVKEPVKKTSVKGSSSKTTTKKSTTKKTK